MPIKIRDGIINFFWLIGVIKFTRVGRRAWTMWCSKNIRLKICWRFEKCENLEINIIIIRIWCEPLF